jgi:hypothetical protein
MKKSIKKLLVTLMPWKSFQIHTWHALEVHWHPCRFGWILLEVNGFTPMACGTHIRKWLFCPFTCPGSSSTSGLLRGGGVHLARAARRGRRWRRGGRLLQRKEPCGSSASTCRWDKTNALAGRWPRAGAGELDAGGRGGAVVRDHGRAPPHVDSASRAATGERGRQLWFTAGRSAAAWRPAEEYLGSLSGFWWFNDTHLSN